MFKQVYRLCLKAMACPAKSTDVYPRYETNLRTVAKMGLWEVKEFLKRKEYLKILLQV